MSEPDREDDDEPTEELFRFPGPAGMFGAIGRLKIALVSGAVTLGAVVVAKWIEDG